MRTLQGTMTREPAARQPLCADIDGFSLRAAVWVEAHDSERRELVGSMTAAGARAVSVIRLFDGRVITFGDGLRGKSGGSETPTSAVLSRRHTDVIHSNRDANAMQLSHKVRRHTPDPRRTRIAR
jgi:hypothetical protein